MKNTFLILCSLLLLVNCKSDDQSGADNNGGGNRNNKMIYNGNEVPLNGVEFYNVTNEGVILYIFENDTYYNGTVVNFRDEYFEDLEGNYTFHMIDPNFDPNSNFWSGSIINHNLTALGEPLTGGEIDLNVSGNSITIDFELQTAEGTAMGHYEGLYQERN